MGDTGNTNNPAPSPKPVKALRGVLEIKAGRKIVEALKAGDNGKVNFGFELQTSRVGGNVIERKVDKSGYVYTDEVAKMPVFYARKHAAWHLTDATPEEVVKFKAMTVQEIAGEYRKG